MSEAGAQLVEELAGVTERLGWLLGAGEALRLRESLEAAQGRIVGLLEAGGDEGRVVAGRVLGLRWAAAEPEAGWWSTPLGRLVGPLAADAAITQAQAAAILGVRRETVGTLLGRGSLARSAEPRPRGEPGRGDAKPKVSRASVLARLARLSWRSPPSRGGRAGRT